MSGGEVAAAAPQYTNAKTSVWWDIENCQVPRDCDADMIALNIKSALSKMGYCGRVSIFAYGDFKLIPNAVQRALFCSGITLYQDYGEGDKNMLEDMLLWAIDNSAPANYLLISGNRYFSSAVHRLRTRGYNILLAQPYKASSILVAAAKSVWLWTNLVAGGGPIKKSDLTQFVNDNAHSNLEANLDYNDLTTEHDESS